MIQRWEHKHFHSWNANEMWSKLINNHTWKTKSIISAPRRHIDLSLPKGKGDSLCVIKSKEWGKLANGLFVLFIESHENWRDSLLLLSRTPHTIHTSTKKKPQKVCPLSTTTTYSTTFCLLHFHTLCCCGGDMESHNNVSFCTPLFESFQQK